MDLELNVTNGVCGVPHHGVDSDLSHGLHAI
jgi:hypothetical protein